MHVREQLNAWIDRLARRELEVDLSRFRDLVHRANLYADDLRSQTSLSLDRRISEIRDRLVEPDVPAEHLPEVFALIREVARREIGLYPFDEQLLAGAAMYSGLLVQMNTGEGKTLAAVLPGLLRAIAGRGVHILTVNDYLARRDAEWMSPIYTRFGLRVGVIQEGLNSAERREAYAADVTYGTAKEVGFDLLRDGLARSTDEIVQRPFHAAIIDEADSILIDEARVPLVIAGPRESSGADPYRIAELVAGLKGGHHWELDEPERNVQLTDAGIDNIEHSLECGNLHDPQNELLLAEVNQALHARVLLTRGVDYIVRGDRIEIVDEFTGRVVKDRRFPDGLQAALEAKEGAEIQQGGRVLGTVTLQSFARMYPQLTGMTATARPAASEFYELYGLRVAQIPPHRPCVRRDLGDEIYTHQSAKQQAVIDKITRIHAGGRPILVGTASVDASEKLAAELDARNIRCRVLNARNDQAEADIIADAGAVGAVTISTNMAGRGTDIKLGGSDERERQRVIDLGGLCVIGTNRHESRRIDDQLRGRAGRQGDPGSSQFVIALNDRLLTRFGIDTLLPRKIRPGNTTEPIDHPVIRREVNRLQRIVEGQNREIRTTLSRYAAIIERQRLALQDFRWSLLTAQTAPPVLDALPTPRRKLLENELGTAGLSRLARDVMLHFIDTAWAEHLAYTSDIREGIHLVGIGGLDPLTEYQKQAVAHFSRLHREVVERSRQTLMTARISGGNMSDTGLTGPSSTWTYMVNDRIGTELQQMLFGHGSSPFSAAAVLMTWPLLFAWALWRRFHSTGGDTADS